MNKSHVKITTCTCMLTNIFLRVGNIKCSYIEYKIYSRFNKKLHMYSTGAKPALGPNCMIPYIKIYSIIEFGPKAGLAPVMYSGTFVSSNVNMPVNYVDMSTLLC